MSKPNPSVSFERVLEEELEQIGHGRQRRGLPPEISADSELRARAFRSNLVGLAFSGGGIRSATFNLGILQGLARWGILPSIDYLSTVSGGGYIGSWLHAWIKRAPHKFAGVYQGLHPNASPPEIQYLRRYANYLTPSTGLLSADTWTMAAIWLRNTMLNQMVLFLAFAALLLFPRVLAPLPDALRGQHWVWGICLIVIAFVVWMIGRNLPRPSKLPGLEDRPVEGQAFIQERIVHPALAACFLLSVWIHGVFDQPNETALLWHCAGFGVGILAVLTIVSLAGDFAEGFGTDRHLASWMGIPAINLTCAAVGTGLLFTIGRALQCRPGSVNNWSTLVWGTPFFLLIFTVVVVLQIGLLGRNFSDDRREWWSRLAAWLLIYLLAWTAIFATAIYGPLLLLKAHAKLENLWSTGVIAAWAATVAAGILAGNSSKTGAEGHGVRIMDFAAKLAPLVFIGGIVLMESLVLHLVILKSTVCAACVGLPGSEALAAGHFSNYLPALPWWQAFIALAVLAWAAAMLGWRIDINEFSLHQFYRNRLMRCYLGASRESRREKELRRHPNPFTGFDLHDDLDLRLLRPDEDYSGPYPIVNCALNLVHGTNLAWQDRKATSWVFTPLHSGFDADDWVRDHPGLAESEREIRHGYCPTNVYAEGSVQLGQAAAISGAAASPNAGYHSSPAAAFLMTIFDVRLGWWIGNPAHPVGWQYTAPHFGFKYLLFELLGLTDANRRFVYLSDGGHFENLAVYELVRRRCRFLIVCDAEQDEKLAFEGLGNAIRKCRTDFGVEIDLNIERLRPDPVTGLSGAHCVVGDLVYPDKDRSGQRLTGRIVYIKASMTGDEPGDVLEYKRRDFHFPHTPTSDQWFDESQFESYRRLGFHTANAIFRNVAEDVIGPEDQRNLMRAGDRERFFRMLGQQWYPPSRAVQAKFSEHSHTLSAMVEHLRSDADLRFLHAQISPEWPTLMQHAVDPPKSVAWLPQTERELRAGFLFCNSMIQLMESVYVDLNLDEEHGHPDNRGWMNLFNHWVWSSMFRVTWAASAATYGARFQTFCHKRLQLDLGKVQARPGTDKDLNFYEKKRFEQVREPGDKVWLLELVVRNPVDGQGLLSYRFGFAVVDSNGCLAYYRVQNHLRNIGLWSAVKPVLKAQEGIQERERVRRPPTMRI